MSPRPTGVLLTSHPSEGGGEGERHCFGQSRASDRRPRPLPCRNGRSWSGKTSGAASPAAVKGRAGTPREAGGQAGLLAGPDPGSERGGEDSGVLAAVSPRLFEVNPILYQRPLCSRQAARLLNARESPLPGDHPAVLSVLSYRHVPKLWSCMFEGIHRKIPN